MNWLFFVSKNCANFDEIELKLKKKKFFTNTLYIEDLRENFICEELNYALNDSDCVVFNLDSSFVQNINCIYALGFVQGRNIPCFVNFECEFENNFISYRDIAELTKILKKNLKTYVALDEEKKAKKLLFERGIPFTPDCFSFEIAKNNHETAQLFLKAGMSVNVRDSAGTPVLCIATRSEKLEMAEWLLENGADIDLVSQDRGYSSVMDAVYKSDYKLVEFFVNHGANLNFVSNDGQTALILATGIGNAKICEILVKNGADPNFKDHMNMSSIEYARLFRNENLVKLYEEYSK